MSRKTILTDARAISGIYWDDFDGECRVVGLAGVTKIEAYEEKGPLDFMPWIAVWMGNAIELRVPAWRVAIDYREEVKND